MEKLLVISLLPQLKAISDPFRLQLLSMMADEPKTGQMLADELDLPRAKIHYHLNQLLTHNIIIVSHTVEKNSITQKFYQPAAETIVPSADIFNFNKKTGVSLYESYNIQLNNEEFLKLTRNLNDLSIKEKEQKETATADEYAVYMMKIMKEA